MSEIKAVESAVGKAAESVASAYRWSDPRFRQLTSMGIAEIACDVVSIGALYFLGCGHGVHAPGKPEEAAKPDSARTTPNANHVPHSIQCETSKDPLKGVKHFVAQNICSPAMPVLQKADWMLSNLWAEGYKKREHLSKQERAAVYADSFVNFSGAFGIGVLTKLLFRNQLNKHFNAEMSPAHSAKVFAVDESAHLAATVAVATVLSKPAGTVTSAISKTLRNVGFSQDQADEAAVYFTTMVVPNAVGFLWAWKLIMKGEAPRLPGK